MAKRDVEHFDIKNNKELFHVPDLVKPDREPDFIVDDSEDARWPCRTLFYVAERILAFEDHQEGDMSLSRILVDERYGIFADETFSQSLRSWGLRTPEVHELYMNWLATQELL